MKSKVITTILLLLSLSLITVGIYGATNKGALNDLNIPVIQKSDEGGIELTTIPINKTEEETPVDKAFENMVEFDTTDKEVKSDNVVEGIVPIGEEKDDRGNLIKKGVDTKVVCADIPPSTVYIPAIQLYSPITNKGNLGTFDKDGYFQLPDRFDRATQWVDGANTSDKEGMSVLAAHRTYSGRYGVFNNLVNLQQGNIACVSDSNGNISQYVVESLKHYKKSELPQELFEDALTGEKKLTIITCGGTLVRKETGGYSFDSNVIATFTKIK